MNALLRMLAWMLAIALIALPLVAFVNGWVGVGRWPLRTLRVEGTLHRVDAAQLRATVLPYARAGFFAVRLRDAQEAVAQLPWVEHAEVRKRWPDVLEVSIVEHQPFARWGTERVLSEHGRLFPLRGAPMPSGLPLLDGPDARVPDVIALYNESRTLFAPGGLAVRSVALDRRGSWSLTLSNGTEVMVGSQEPQARLTRFARMLPQLLSQKQQPLARADLRYTNGFALSWASDRKQADANASAAVGERPAMDGRAGRSEAAGAAPWMAAVIHQTEHQVLQRAGT